MWSRYVPINFIQLDEIITGFGIEERERKLHCLTTSGAPQKPLTLHVCVVVYVAAITELCWCSEESIVSAVLR